MRSKNIIFIAKLIFLAVALFVFFYVFPLIEGRNRKNFGCDVYKDIYGQQFKIKVEKEFTDSSNHNTETIVYDQNNRQGTMTMVNSAVIMTSDRRKELFASVMPGDSVIKDNNSTTYKLKAKTTGTITIFELHTMCKDSIKLHRSKNVEY